MTKHFLAGVFALSLSQSAMAQTLLPNIKEGMWELSFNASTAAMPTPMPSVAYTTKKCLSQETAADPQTFLESQACNISSLNQQGDVLSWNMRCLQQNKDMIGNGTVNYKAEYFNAILNSTMQGEKSGAMTTTTQINGRYLGACQ